MVGVRIPAVFVVLKVGHVSNPALNVTEQPTAAWTIQQFRVQIARGEPFIVGRAGTACPRCARKAGHRLLIVSKSGPLPLVHRTALRAARRVGRPQGCGPVREIAPARLVHGFGAAAVGRVEGVARGGPVVERMLDGYPRTAHKAYRGRLSTTIPGGNVWRSVADMRIDSLGDPPMNRVLTAMTVFAHAVRRRACASPAGARERREFVVVARIHVSPPRAAQLLRRLMAATLEHHCLTTNT